jgi:acyl dehydratase
VPEDDAGSAPVAEVGKRWPAREYEVGREKIREYADVLGCEREIHRDHEAAREAGFRAAVAPPTFAAVYVARSLAEALFAPESGIFEPELGLAGYRFVQRRQRFRWHEPVCSGDRISTVATLVDADDRDGARHRAFESESVNQDGDLVLEGRYEGVVPALSGDKGRSGGSGRSDRSVPKRGEAPLDGPAGLRAGDRFPEFRVTPDRYAAQRYAGASGDFTPFHLDPELARAIGLPGIILHGLYTYGLLARGLLEPFDGDPRGLRSLAARFRRPAVPEAELVLRGRVEEAGEEGITVACAVEQEGREVLSEGIAELVLSDRRRG